MGGVDAFGALGRGGGETNGRFEGEMRGGKVDVE